MEATAKAPPLEDGDGPGPSSCMLNGVQPRRTPDGGPPDLAQRNFTDPDSRLQPVEGGVIQGYDAQAVVDRAFRVIVAEHMATNAPTAPPWSRC